MDFESQLAVKRKEILVDIADMYYNRNMTQSEIAKIYTTNRFRIAKLIQEAKNEKIVEIHINSDNERNPVLEEELEKKLGLQKAIVVNSSNGSYVSGINVIGKVGARYLNSLVEEHTVIGATWGKTIHSVISQMEGGTSKNVEAVQMCGRFRSRDSVFSSREMVRMLAKNYNGKALYVYLPLYLRLPELVPMMKQEPLVRECFTRAQHMDIVISGIGGKSSCPLTNTMFEDYFTDVDRKAADTSLGSIYGYVLDAEGKVADIDLNKKVIACDLEDIKRVPHRIIVAIGRHKLKVIIKARQQNLYNELITDYDTAVHLLENISKN